MIWRTQPDTQIQRADKAWQCQVHSVVSQDIFNRASQSILVQETFQLPAPQVTATFLLPAQVTSMDYWTLLTSEHRTMIAKTAHSTSDLTDDLRKSCINLTSTPAKASGFF